MKRSPLYILSVTEKQISSKAEQRKGELRRDGKLGGFHIASKEAHD